jgi:hypothetical protein
VLGEQHLEEPLALDLRHGAKLVVVEVKRVEGVVLDAALLPARERRLELGEVVRPSFMMTASLSKMAWPEYRTPR